MLKYLYDQLAGRAALVEKETVDPEIVVIFADIDCDDPVELPEGVTRYSSSQIEPIGIGDDAI
jgi:hypothetical protein